MGNSQLLVLAVSGGDCTNVPAQLQQKFVDTKSPEFCGLLTAAFVSLWYEFQENQVGRLTDLANLLFFKWTINESGEHGLGNIIHTCLLHLDHLHIILFWLAYPLLCRVNEYVEGPLRPIPH